MDRRIVNPWSWQDEFGFVQANDVGGGGRVLFCSGQTSVDPEGNPMHPGDMRSQMTLALDNLETLLGASGFGLGDIMRLNVYTTDMDGFFENYDALITRLAEGGCRHTGSLLGVTRLAFPELMVELEATAVA